MRVYYVNPANTSDVSLVQDQNGRSETPLGRTTLPDGRVVERIEGPIPEWDVYEGRADTTPQPDYYLFVRIDGVFNGAVQDPAAFVQETNVYEQMPIAELYEVKRGEVRDQDAYVRYNAVDTSLSINWWVVITDIAQQELLWVSVGSNSRQINNQGWPTGDNVPLVAVYNTQNQRVRREAISSQAIWDTIELEIAQHLQATSNATKDSGDALDAAYDNGNGAWQDVADHDAADPLWGYPPTVNGALMREALNQAGL